MYDSYAGMAQQVCLTSCLVLLHAAGCTVNSLTLNILSYRQPRSVCKRLVNTSCLCV
jgi:hypothetical protein